MAGTEDRTVGTADAEELCLLKCILAKLPVPSSREGTQAAGVATWKLILFDDIRTFMILSFPIPQLSIILQFFEKRKMYVKYLTVILKTLMGGQGEICK